MARLGELLVAAGRITAAQLDEGLRAQVLYGGRLGTNLVELFHLELDAIALALARLHGVPAALGKHFERCDVTVQARLPAELAARWSVVPIGRLADRRERIAIASSDPLSPDAAAELAARLGVAADALVVSIAAELRIRYYLERAYKIARPSRYLRVRRETQHEIPRPPPRDVDSDPGIDVDVDEDLDPDQTGTIVHTPTGQIPRRAPPRPPSPAALDEDDAPTMSRVAPVVDDDEPVAEIELDPDVEQVLVHEKRRRFVRTLAELDADADAEIDVEPALPEAAPEAPVLARIAIRKAPAGRADAGLGRLDDATRTIRRATTREKVGELVVRAAMQIADAGLDAAVLFVVREPIAIGWKGEVAGGEPAIDEIAVPLDAPNAIARAFRTAEPVALDLAAADVTALDRRLIGALGGTAPARLAVAPVVIGGQPVCLLYAHGRAADLEIVTRLAEAASHAFVRLLRQAQR